MGIRRAFTWRAAYVAAVWEVDPSKEFGRIADALIKVEARIKDDAGMDTTERLAIEAARHHLRMMEAQRLTDRLQELTLVSGSHFSRLIH